MCAQAQSGASSREMKQAHTACRGCHACTGWVCAAGGLTVGAYMYHDHLGVVLGFAGQLPMLQPPQQLLDPVAWREQHASQSVWLPAWQVFSQDPSPACKVDAMAAFVQRLGAHEVRSTSSNPH